MTIPCKCGTVYLPKGSKHDPNGIFVRLYLDNNYLDCKLVHNQDSYLTSNQTFVTSSEKITVNENININKIRIYCDNIYNLSIDHAILIVIKSYNTKQILAQKNIGTYGESIPFNVSEQESKIFIELENNYIFSNSINLYNDKLQIEIFSLCEPIQDNCCFNNSYSILTKNDVAALLTACCPTTTSTTPPPPVGACCENGILWNNESQSWTQYNQCLGVMTESQCDPYVGSDSQRVWLSGLQCFSCSGLDFCSSFFLPSSFPITVVGYGDLDGQELASTVIKNNNTYSTSGTFPCGTYFELSMTCDEQNEEFVYNGLISCCNQSTKWIKDPTPTPLLYPNARTPHIIGYLDCSSCVDCVTTTTTTTTLPPSLPCDSGSFGPLTINGYAFYRDSNRTVNIPNIGETRILCAGGHVCNRTDFIPQLILDTMTINGQQISMNNYPDGGDREATFSFSIPDITLIQGNPKIKLECVSPVGCHEGVTAIILTTTIDNETIIIFNSCLVPGNLVPLEICEPVISAPATLWIKNNSCPAIVESINNLQIFNSNNTTCTNSQGIYFNGYNQSLSLLSNDAFNLIGDVAFTIDFWMNMTSYSNGYTTILTRRYNYPSATWQWLIGFADPSSRRLYFSGFLPNGFTSTLQSVDEIPLNQWVHIAASVVPGNNYLGTGYLFINGQLVDGPRGWFYQPDLGHDLHIAQQGSLFEYYNGYLDDIRIRKNFAYTANFTPEPRMQ